MPLMKTENREMSSSVPSKEKKKNLPTNTSKVSLFTF